MDKEQMLRASMVNVQQNITTQINIGVVNGNYFQHVENVNIGAPAKEQEQRKKDFLFADAEANRREAKRFVSFLKKEEIDSVEVDTTEGNPVNRAFVAFCRYWIKKRVLSEQLNAAACFRFLKDECKRSFGVAEKGYVNFIRKMIAEVPDEKLGDMPMKMKVHLA